MAFIVPDEIDRYVHAHTSEMPDIFRALAEETHANLPMPQMQIGRVEGQLLRLLVQLSGARRILEIGTYSGYSALAMASALPTDGALITCDVDPVATRVAQRFFDQTPWGNLIEIRLGPAAETMATLQEGGERFDLVFIDADKTNYANYYERAMSLIDTGGLIVLDNTLWSGTVVNPETEDARAIAETNARIAADSRVDQVLLSVRDGVLIVRKRPPKEN